MGTDHFIGCADCRDFIDLHKWPILVEAASALIRAHGLPHRECGTFVSTVLPEVSPQPVVLLSTSAIDEALAGQLPQHEYIERLRPQVALFSQSHTGHSVFLTCDIGDLPWEIGSRAWATWREIHPEGGWQGQFLPRNLVDDLGFDSWQGVLEYYRRNAAWFLDEQLREDRLLLREAFEAYRRGYGG